jgi:hypothetical protein
VFKVDALRLNLTNAVGTGISATRGDIAQHAQLDGRK